VPQDWAIAHCNTTAGAKMAATGTTTLLPCPLIVICFFAVVTIIAIAAKLLQCHQLILVAFQLKFP